MAATEVKRRRGTSAQCAAFLGAQGELVVDLTNKRVILHDGSLTGGYPQASETYVNTAVSGVAAGAPGMLLAQRALFK